MRVYNGRKVKNYLESHHSTISAVKTVETLKLQYPGYDEVYSKDLKVKLELNLEREVKNPVYDIVITQSPFTTVDRTSDVIGFCISIGECIYALRKKGYNVFDGDKEIGLNIKTPDLKGVKEDF